MAPGEIGEIYPLSNPALDTEASQALPEIFHRHKPEIRAALRKELAESPLQLYQMLRYSMGWSDVSGNPTAATEGKALRPTLCLLACEATGTPAEMAMPAAVSLEFIHDFSLIHDEIQDLDDVRHHRPTLWVVWGKAKALVAGNALRTIADKSLHSLLEGGLSVTAALEANALLTAGYLEMIEGQYMDLHFEGRTDITLPDYMGMIARKTGALIRCSLVIGATVGTRDPEIVEAFRRCGESLGLIFQVRDDLLGVWGDEASTGKPVGADLRRRKTPSLSYTPCRSPRARTAIPSDESTAKKPWTIRISTLLWRSWRKSGRGSTPRAWSLNTANGQSTRCQPSSWTLER